MASMGGEVSYGTYLLSFYSLGLAIPFIVSSLLFDRLFALLKRYGSVARYAVKVLGVLLICLGLLMVTSYYNAFNFWIGFMLPSGT